MIEKSVQRLIKTANGEVYDFGDVLPLCDADLMCRALTTAFEASRIEWQKGRQDAYQKALQVAYDVHCCLYAYKHNKQFFLDEGE